MPIVNVVIIQQWKFLVFHLNKKTIYGLCFQNDPICHTPFFLDKHEEKFTPASIMLSFLRISGSNYAYDMLNTLTAKIIFPSFYCIFGIYIKLGTFSKKDEPHSSSISAVIDSEIRAYLNA